MKTLLRIVVFFLFASAIAFAFYFLAGSEERCLFKLQASDHPLTCAVLFEVMFDLVYGAIGALVLIPLWQYLSVSSRPAIIKTWPTLWCSSLPLALGALVFFLRLPHTTEPQALWESLCLAAPLLLALAAVSVLLPVSRVPSPPVRAQNAA